MDDLVEWLCAQFDDDERTALRVLRFSRESYALGAFESWVAERKVNNTTPPYYDYREVRTERPGTRQKPIMRVDDDFGATAEHIARFASPRRVLLDIRGKREMLGDIMAVPRFRREPMLKLLAQVYDDRPGYLEEWRP